MKKILLTASLLFSLFAANSQVDTSRNQTTNTTVTNNTTSTPRRPITDIDLSNRSNDHLLLQYGFDRWSGAPDSASPSGFSRHFNAYFMFDKPFKTNPRFSVGLGAGIGSSNIFFDKTNVDITSSAAQLPFTNVDSANHYKKFKLTTVFLEAPVELRYSSNPGTNKSFKMALGAKVGTLINAHTKGKTLQNKSNQTIGDYTTKISNKRYFNSTRLAATARVGYGIFSISAQYNITTLLKEGAGPDIRPYSIGITLSGL